MIKKISTILAILLIVLIVIYDGFSDFGIDGNKIFLLICIIIINPIRNLYMNNKKIIDNNWYYLLLTIFVVFGIFIYTKSIVIIFEFGMNQANLYLYNKLFYMLVSVIALGLISLLFKKTKYQSNKNYSNFIYAFIAFICFSKLLSEDPTQKLYIIGYLLGIFLIALIFKENEIIVRNDMQKIYFVMFIMSLISCNFSGCYLLLNLYFKLDDKFTLV